VGLSTAEKEFPMSVPAPRQTSSYAIVALVAGILGWTLLPFLGSLAAIIFGHMGRAEIRRHWPGAGLAVGSDVGIGGRGVRRVLWWPGVDRRLELVSAA